MVGRFHPLLVHLPIGILLVALLFEWLSIKEKFKSLQPAIYFLLLTGAVAAIVSCITGYLLSIQSDYQENIVTWHMALGISTAVISSGLFFVRRLAAPVAKRLYAAGCVLLFVLVAVTGHLGGSLTHGSTYLTDKMPSPFKGWFSGTEPDARMIVNVQNAFVYEDVVKPILEAKCRNCHGESRQKGGLRLDLPEFILKGGKKGKTLVVGNPLESEMIKRIYLPLDHEHHMPPRGKGQITPAEAEVLSWWITEGANFQKKVGEIPQPEAIKPILENLQSSDPEKTIFADTDMPQVVVRSVPDSMFVAFRNRSITLVPVTRASSFLSASFIAIPETTDEGLNLLLPIAKNIVILKLGNTKITDKSLQTVAKFENLIRLNLEHTAVTDEGLKQIKNLGELKYLNMVGTKVTVKGIVELQSLKKLKKMFLFQTTVESSDLPMLKEKLPAVEFDLGGYKVPTTIDDTTKVTVKK